MGTTALHCSRCEDLNPIRGEPVPILSETIPVLPDLTVMLVNARGLPSMGSGSALFGTVRPSSWAKRHLSTRSISDVLDPYWKEEAVITDYEKHDNLEFSVWASGAERETTPVGVACLQSEDYQPNGFNGELLLREAGVRVVAHLMVKVRIDPREYPDPTLQEYTITVKKSAKKSLGIDVDIQDGCSVYVGSVNSGPINSYNQTAKPRCRLTPGHFIVQVNGQRSEPAAMLKTMKSEPDVELLVRRAVEIRANIVTGCRDNLGLEFGKPTGNMLLITKVINGPLEHHARAVQSWNEANPDQRILAGDRIISVNNTRGRAQDLLKHIRASVKQESVLLTAVRLPASDDTLV